MCKSPCVCKSLLCCKRFTGKHHGLKDEWESKIYVSRGRNVPSEISYKKACYTFLNVRFLNAMLATWLAAVALTATDAGGTLGQNSIACCCLLLLLLLLLVQLTLQKGSFRQGNPHANERRQRLLLLCPQRHGLARRGNTMALKDERSPKHAFPEAGTSLLKSPTKSLLYVSRGWLLARC